MAVALPLLVLLTLVLASSVVALNAAWAQMEVFSGSEFYFHYRSQLYRNENSSIIGLEEANLSLPIGRTPAVVEVAAAIRNATTIFGTVWVGSVAWLTQPFAEPAMIHGQLVFTVWLSSNDPSPSFSGVGAGVAVLDERGRPVGNYAYSYSYAQGSVLTATPKQYTFRIDFNQEITPGEKLILAVGLGSTTPYWHMQVHFDGTDYPSRVQLPTSVTVIPEFAMSDAGLTTLIAISLSLALQKRRREPSKRPRRERASLCTVTPVCGKSFVKETL